MKTVFCRSVQFDNPNEEFTTSYDDNDAFLSVRGKK